jgi:hypothetical protein
LGTAHRAGIQLNRSDLATYRPQSVLFEASYTSLSSAANSVSLTAMQQKRLPGSKPEALEVA